MDPDGNGDPADNDVPTPVAFGASQATAIPALAPGMLVLLTLGLLMLAQRARRRAA